MLIWRLPSSVTIPAMVITLVPAPPVRRLLMLTPSARRPPPDWAASVARRRSRARASAGWLETNIFPVPLSYQRKAGIPALLP